MEACQCLPRVFTHQYIIVDGKTSYIKQVLMSPNAKYFFQTRNPLSLEIVYSNKIKLERKKLCKKQQKKSIIRKSTQEAQCL